MGDAAVEKVQMDEAGATFLSQLEGQKINSKILFKDYLTTISEATGKEVGELTITIDSSSYNGKECYLVSASSNGAVDNIPVGTNITAYVTPGLETLEHTQHEYVNIPGKSLNKKSVLTRSDTGYNLVYTTTDSDEENVVEKNFESNEMKGFISEGANLVLQRLCVTSQYNSFTKMSFVLIGSDNVLASVTYSPLEKQNVTLQSVPLQTAGVERSVVSDNPTTWQVYLLADGHMYTRSQKGSPVYMKIKNLPDSFSKDQDADWVFPDFGKGNLNWEDDLEMLSQFLDRKQNLQEDHINYMKRHPELKAILGDFLQFLLMRKPADVIEFAADFFSSYSVNTEMKPSFAHSEFVNKSAIKPE